LYGIGYTPTIAGTYDVNIRINNIYISTDLTSGVIVLPSMEYTATITHKKLSQATLIFSTTTVMSWYQYLFILFYCNIDYRKMHWITVLNPMSNITSSAWINKFNLQGQVKTPAVIVIMILILCRKYIVVKKQDLTWVIHSIWVNLHALHIVQVMLPVLFVVLTYYRECMVQAMHMKCMKKVMGVHWKL